MQFNVAKLLKSPAGDERRYTFDESEPRFPELAGTVHGEVRLMRTDRGIMAMADIDTAVGCTCSRCLRGFVQPVKFSMTEEYFPTIDIASGVEVEAPSGDYFTIDHHHILDLGEAVREYAIFNSPMKPLCAETCAGLCPTCGADLNQTTCDCPKSQIDSRWAKLVKIDLRN